MEIELGTELLEKSSIAVLIEDNSIFTLTIKELKKSIEDGIIKSNSIIFNNLVPTLGELDSNWKLPVEKTWVSKYFNK